MPQRILTVLVLLVAFVSCRDGPGAFAGPAQESLILPPDAVASQRAIQVVTDILEDPFVHQLVQDVDDRGTVSRLRNSVRGVSRTTTEDERVKLHRAFATAQMEMMTAPGEGDEESEADREILRAVLALVLADAGNMLDAARTRDVTGNWVQR